LRWYSYPQWYDGRDLPISWRAIVRRVSIGLGVTLLTSTPFGFMSAFIQSHLRVDIPMHHVTVEGWLEVLLPSCW
jgi:hypothetical protein